MLATSGLNTHNIVLLLVKFEKLKIAFRILNSALLLRIIDRTKNINFRVAKFASLDQIWYFEILSKSNSVYWVSKIVFFRILTDKIICNLMFECFRLNRVCSTALLKLRLNETNNQQLYCTLLRELTVNVIFKPYLCNCIGQLEATLEQCTAECPPLSGKGFAGRHLLHSPNQSTCILSTKRKCML